MLEASCIVLGGTGFIGSAVLAHLERLGELVICINSRNYAHCLGARAKVLINCNGNTFHYRANQDPRWDFEASVVSVERSLFDFRFDLYIYVSTVDVYNVLHDPARNHEGVLIQPERLDAYGFHKWLAERLVEKFAARSAILRVGTVVGDGLKKGPLFDLLNAQPLRMSLDSELTFIDTPTIAKAISLIIDTQPKRQTINLTGTGSAKLRDFRSRIPWPIKMAEGAEAVKHCYNVNNETMRRIMPIPPSFEIAAKFLDDFVSVR